MSSKTAWVVLICAAALATSCRATGPGLGRAEPDRARGDVRGLAQDERGHVTVHRYGPDDIVRTAMGQPVPVAPSGRFRTPVLLPGRYLLVLRAPGRPPSVVTTLVPLTGRVTITARDRALASLVLVAGEGVRSALAGRLSYEDAEAPAVEMRDVVVRPGAPSEFSGVRAGRWRLDFGRLASTIAFDVPDVDGAAKIELVVTPPPPGTGRVHGRVLFADGTPGAGLVVTVRPLIERGNAATAWGRFARTDSDGGYEVLGVPVGDVLLRVENRDAVAPRLPRPERVAIPPSGVLHRSFVVGP